MDFEVMGKTGGEQKEHILHLKGKIYRDKGRKKGFVVKAGFSGMLTKDLK
jgi:hypothetical protein